MCSKREAGGNSNRVGGSFGSGRSDMPGTSSKAMNAKPAILVYILQSTPVSVRYGRKQAVTAPRIISHATAVFGDGPTEYQLVGNRTWLNLLGDTGSFIYVSSSNGNGTANDAGKHDIVSLIASNGETINDQGQGTNIALIDMAGKFPHVTIAGLENDPTASLTIVNGGFPNAQSVVADSLPNGHGGTITQGSGLSIDFSGDADISKLHINIINT